MLGRAHGPRPHVRAQVSRRPSLVGRCPAACVLEGISFLWRELPRMKHYDFAPRFEQLYRKAVTRYEEGVRSAAGLFAPEETAWLAGNGITPQHLFDYAEDHTNYGEPGLANAVTIEAV